MLQASSIGSLLLYARCLGDKGNDAKGVRGEGEGGGQAVTTYTLPACSHTVSQTTALG